MKKNLNVAAVLALAVLASNITVAQTTTPVPAAKKADALFPDKVVAKGKGFEVKESEVEEAFIAYKSSLATQGQQLPDAQRQTVQDAIRDQLILTKVLLGKATDADKAKAMEKTAKVVEDAKKRFPSEEVFMQQLKAAGLTLEAFKNKLIERGTCEAVLERELKTTIKINDAAVKKFYDENPGKFEMPETVRASHILISTVDSTTQQPLPAEKKKEKEKTIQGLKARAEKGEDFAKLAKEFSEDPGSKDKGGEYTFPRGQMVPAFEAAAFSLKTNQVSDVVETQFGYHIIKLSEKNPAKKVEFAKVTNDIKENLTMEEFEKLLPAYIEKVKKEAGAEIIGAKAPAATEPAKPAAK